MWPRVIVTAVLAAPLLGSGCGGSPVAPSAVTTQRPTWVLAGQSNAVGLERPLSQYAILITSTLGGAPILHWTPPDGPLWPALSATLVPEVTRFVWFQGESDADLGVIPGAPSTTAYVERLRDLVARVRAGTRPNLFVVVCGMTDAPANKVAFDAMRAELQRFVGTDRNAVYVSTLDLPSGNSQHLTDEGYATLAARIAAVAVPRMSFSR